MNIHSRVSELFIYREESPMLEMLMLANLIISHDLAIALQQKLPDIRSVFPLQQPGEQPCNLVLQAVWLCVKPCTAAASPRVSRLMQPHSRLSLGRANTTTMDPGDSAPPPPPPPSQKQQQQQAEQANKPRAWTIAEILEVASLWGHNRPLYDASNDCFNNKILHEAIYNSIGQMLVRRRSGTDVKRLMQRMRRGWLEERYCCRTGAGAMGGAMRGASAPQDHDSDSACDEEEEELPLRSHQYFGLLHFLECGFLVVAPATPTTAAQREMLGSRAQEANPHNVAARSESRPDTARVVSAAARQPCRTLPQPQGSQYHVDASTVRAGQQQQQTPRPVPPSHEAPADADIAFAHYVQCELLRLPVESRHIAKLRIQQVLFSHQQINNDTTRPVEHISTVVTNQIRNYNHIIEDPSRTITISVLPPVIIRPNLLPQQQQQQYPTLQPRPSFVNQRYIYPAATNGGLHPYHFLTAATSTIQAPRESDCRVLYHGPAGLSTQVPSTTCRNCRNRLNPYMLFCQVCGGTHQDEILPLPTNVNPPITVPDIAQAVHETSLNTDSFQMSPSMNVPQALSPLSSPETKNIVPAPCPSAGNNGVKKRRKHYSSSSDS